MTVIPHPAVGIAEAAARVSDPSAGLSDLIRCVGVAVAVAGLILATPDGLASAAIWVRNKCRWLWTRIKRIFRRPKPEVHTTAAAGLATATGTAGAYRWQAWPEDGNAEEKIEALHEQVELMLKQIQSHRVQTRQSVDRLQSHT